MFGLRANWPLAITAALTSTLMLGPAHARGGGHPGAMAHPMMSTSHFATTPLPGLGVSGVHPGAGMRGGMLPQLPGPMRSPSTIVPPAIVARPQILQSPFGASSRNGRASAGVTGLVNSGIGAIPAPPPQGVTPQSEIAAPAPELAPIAPLSPQQPTQFSTGGVVRRTWRCRQVPPPRRAPASRRRARPAVEASRWLTAWGLGSGDAHDQSRVEGGLCAHHARRPNRAAVIEPYIARRAGLGLHQETKTDATIRVA